MSETADVDSISSIEEAKTALRRAAEERGEPLTQSEYRSWRQTQAGSYPCASTIAYRLADRSWTEACRSAGVTSGGDTGTGRGKAYTTTELETALEQAAEAAGKPLTTGKYNTWRSDQTEDYPSVSIISTRLADGSWIKACETVGINAGKPKRHDPTLTEADVADSLQRAAEERGEPLTQSEYAAWRAEQDDDHPSAPTIAKYIADGTWSGACESAGVQPGQRGGAPTYTIQDLKTTIKQARDDIGGIPSSHEYETWRENHDADLPGFDTLTRRLGNGSWREACRFAGVTQ